MKFSNFSNSQLSRDEMRFITGANSLDAGDGGKSSGEDEDVICSSHCETSADCDMVNGCSCQEIHGHLRCVS